MFNSCNTPAAQTDQEHGRRAHMRQTDDTPAAGMQLHSICMQACALLEAAHAQVPVMPDDCLAVSLLENALLIELLDAGAGQELQPHEPMLQAWCPATASQLS
jgi:hypothetical protein